MIVWVIEQKDSNGDWVPTASCGITRQAARRKMDLYWKFNYPDIKFRVKKYVQV